MGKRYPWCPPGKDLAVRGAAHCLQKIFRCVANLIYIPGCLYVEQHLRVNNKACLAFNVGCQACFVGLLNGMPVVLKTTVVGQWPEPFQLIKLGDPP